MRASMTGEPLLSGGPAGAARVRALADLAMTTVAEVAGARSGPVPAGGPVATAAAVARALAGGVLPEHGIGATAALRELTALLATGSVDPGHPWCAAHLHGPTLAVAAAADLVAGVLNPSMDSWDQAPAASELEREVTAALARLCFPAAGAPDAVITSGGTESNLVGLLLAREHGHTRVVCGQNAHHSVARATWLLGLPAPRVVAAERGRLRAGDLDLAGGEVVVATAGTTDTGAIDPLPEVARAARAAGAWLHVDASYGGAALLSDRLAARLAGLDQADSVAVDLHKFGWQPIAAGVLATRAAITALHVRADYLNADDDTEAGLPDLLGRSLRTSRRPDCLKIAVTLRAVGRQGIARLVERCCELAGQVADEVERHPGLELWGRPELSTVLVGLRRGDVAAVRRRLLEDGTAVVGRATVDGRVWLKLTLLNPAATLDDYRGLLDLVVGTAGRTTP
jgi:L-2,4-diaminobutyrate decarboxylase